MTGHVIICGLGQIGFRSFELLRGVGTHVVVITDRAPDDWRHTVTAAGGQVIIGDAQSDVLLTQAGIADAAAVLAVTDHDLVNISVAMDARRLNPRVRVVCRLFDTNLGAQVSPVLGIDQILSASEIAAPVFIRAVMDSGAIACSTHTHIDFSLEEHRTGASRAGVAVIAARAEGGRIVGGREVHEASDPKLVVRLIERERRSKGTDRLPGMLAWFSLPSLAKFRRAVLFMLVVIASAAAVIKLRMGLPWMDALYFVTTTITTVGYGDFNFANSGPGMKLFGVTLMLLGAASLTLLFSTLADAFLSERFSSLFGGRGMPRRDHVIVTGAGHIGQRIVEQLTNDGVAVAVIENDRVGRFPSELKRKIAVVEGDGRRAETLQRVHAARARAILVVSDDDVENLSVGLSVHAVNPAIASIIRVFDADLSSKLQSKFASSRILSVSRIAAPYFAAAALAGPIAAAVRWQDHLVFLSETAGPSAVGSIALGDGAADLVVHAIPLR